MKEVTDKRESVTDCCGEEGQRNSLLPLISCCGFDDSELALLDAIRHFCCGFCVEDYDGYRPAWERLCLLWEPSESARLLSSIGEFMDALQKFRPHSFEFIGPFCPHCSKRICKSELELMLLTREARAADPGRVIMAAQYVVGRGKAKDIVPIALKLGMAMQRSTIGEISRPGNIVTVH